MPISFQLRFATILAFTLTAAVWAQSGGSSGSISGTVSDPTGAVVPYATVEIHNPVSHFGQSTTTDKFGKFSFPNVPFNPYHMAATAAGFAPSAQDVEVRSVVPVNVNVSLQVSGSTIGEAGSLRTAFSFGKTFSVARVVNDCKKNG